MKTFKSVFKKFVLLVSLIVSVKAFAMPIHPGYRDGDNCEKYLMTGQSIHTQWTPTSRVHAASSELLLFMIMEHPIQLQASKKSSEVSVSDLKALFHISMGAMARPKPYSSFLRMDPTGFSRLVNRPSKEYKAFLNSIDQARDKARFEETSLEQRTYLARGIVYSTIQVMGALGKWYKLSVGKEWRTLDVPISVGELYNSYGVSTQKHSLLSITNFNAFNDKQLQRMYELSAYLNPESMPRPPSTERVPEAQLQSEATAARELSVKFVAAHLAEMLEVRELIYLDRKRSPGYGQVGGIRGALQEYEYGTTRARLADKILALAKGNLSEPVKVIPPPKAEKPHSPLSFRSEMVAIARLFNDMESEDSDKVAHFRQGMRIFDDVIEKLPTSDYLKLGAKVPAEELLATDSSSLLKVINEIEDKTRDDLSSLSRISASSTELAKRMNEIATETMKANSDTLSDKQKLNRNEEIALSQVTLAQSLALIQSRVDQFESVITLTNQLQALIRQYRHLAKLEEDNRQLGENIVAILRKLKI